MLIRLVHSSGRRRRFFGIRPFPPFSLLARTLLRPNSPALTALQYHPLAKFPHQIPQMARKEAINLRKGILTRPRKQAPVAQQRDSYAKHGVADPAEHDHIAGEIQTICKNSVKQFISWSKLGVCVAHSTLSTLSSERGSEWTSAKDGQVHITDHSLLKV
jgi:hypothetical protein